MTTPSTNSGTIIKTKYSSSTAEPSSNTLYTGEQAYSFTSQKLFIGDATTPNNLSLAIGGKHYTDQLMHATNDSDKGIVVALKALVVDGNKKLNELRVDDLMLDGSTLSATLANGNVIIDANGSGTIQLTSNTVISGTLTLTGAQQTFAGQTTLASLNVTDLTAGRILFAGTSGELVDDADLTYNGTQLHVVGSILVDNLDLNGNTLKAVNSNGDVILAPDGTGDILLSSSKGTLIVPKGVQTDRPAVVTGASGNIGGIRYNDTTHTFEGVHSTPAGGGVWKGIGGVSDIDQDTYITAETDNATTPTTVNNTLRFFVSDVLEMSINASGMSVTDQITTPIGNISTVNIDTKLNVTTADVTFTNGIDVTGGDVDITADLRVLGNTYLGNALGDHTVISGNLTVAGTTTTIESVTTTVTDPVMELASDSTTTAAVNDRGINFKYGDGTTIQTGFFGMDMATKRFSFQKVLGTGDTAADDNKFNAPWGDAQFNSLFLSGNQITDGTLNVKGAVDLDTTLLVNGVTTLDSLLNANGGINCDSGKFIVADTSGNVSTQGTLTVTGATTLSSTLDGVGAVDFSSTLNVDGAVTNKSTTALGSTGQMQITAAGVMTHGTIDGVNVTIDCGTF
jgi:hypothetical protein